MKLLPILAGFVFTFIVSSICLGSSPPKHNPFIPNLGQWNGEFKYKTEVGNLAVYIEERGFTYVLSENLSHDHAEDDHHLPDLINKHAFRLRYKGALPISYTGKETQRGYHNYFIGSDRSKWKGHVPLYSQIESTEIYPGITMIAYQSPSGLKYDYVIAPESDPGQIKFYYSGTEGVSTTKEGLRIQTSVGDLFESIPISYQIINGEKVEVKCKYKSSSDGFSFSFPDGYDPDLPLIIDPILVAATLSGTGSGGSNYGHGAAFDMAGNIYTHAISFNSAYPVTEGAFQELYGGGGTDVAISKLNPDGSELIYASFIGGDLGEYPHSIITNNNQELYVVGSTSSSNFPTSLSAVQTEFGGGGNDIFITALSIDGSQIEGSSFLGGSSNDGVNATGFVSHGDARSEVYIDLNSNVYVASSSSSENFPTTTDSFQPIKKGGQDGVLVKLNPDLSELIWSTFVGSDQDDMVYGVRTSQSQEVFITGCIGGISNGGSAEGFTVTPGSYQESFGGGQNDAFVARVSDDGTQLLNSTLLGEEGDDQGLFLDLDNQENVWVYMQSSSVWELSSGVWGTNAEGNISVHKLNHELTELQVTSYLTNQTGPGGSGSPVAFMVDLCNNIYISCYGASSTFVASDDAIFSAGGFYLGVFTPEMEDLSYGTFYTGGHVDGGTSRFDKQGIVYQGVCSGGGFNTTDNAYAQDQVTGYDIGVFKIDFEIESVNAVAGAVGMLTGCAPHTVEFTNYSSGDSYLWDFGDGVTSTEVEPSHLYSDPGEYLVTLVLSDPESCNLTDTAFIPITVFPEVDFFTDFSWVIDCESGELLITDASEGPEDIEYVWDMGDGTILTDQNPIYIYENPGTYTVTLTLISDACNQEMTEEQEVNFIPYIEADFDVSVIDICDAFLINVANQSEGGADFTWTMGDGNTLTETGSFEYVYASSGTYTIGLIIEDELSCNLSDTTFVEVVLIEPPVLSPEISISQTGLCEELTYLATVEPNGTVETYSWLLNNELVGSDASLDTIVNSPGLYTVTVVVTDPVCQHEFTNTIEFEFYEYLGFELPTPLSLCYYEESVFLNATVPFPEASYDWNGGLSTDPILEVSSAGQYEVTVGFNGCVEIQESNVNAIPDFPLSFQELICENQSNNILFEDANGIVEAVSWEDGQTGFQIEVSQGGYYPFTAIDLFGCEQVDSLLAIARDDDPNLDIPNVFTPNGDGKNEVFQIQGDSLVFYNLDVINRWGKQVFSTDQIYAPWDGVLHEESGNEGGENNFVYILKYRDQCDLENQVLTGNISILR